MSERHKYATRFEKREQLPDNAIKITLYAEQTGVKNPAYINVKYDRYLKGGTYPGYKIINFQGSNFVIPD